MKLNDIWGYGQLFGYSALDGPNRYYNDFIGTLTEEKVGIRFELREWVKVIFPVKECGFAAITGDMIDGTADGGRLFITFADADTLVGYCPAIPEITGEKPLKHVTDRNADVWYNDVDAFGVRTIKTDGGYKFCVHHSFNMTEARSGANFYINCDVEELKNKRYAYFENMPPCKDARFEQLYYKALSVNKVNVHSPEGRIPFMWTTPDRVPHRHMWLWDSVFHALAIVNYNKQLAKDAIKAVISQIHPDGFIPHMMNPTDFSDVTQPQVLAWGVWEVYRKTGDKSFLRYCSGALEKYLLWDMRNRDKNGNGLLEWLTEPEYSECKCGESGQDDSPRFDFDCEMDAVDFSAFAAHDALYLSYIFKELGAVKKSEKWAKVYEDIKKAVNDILWDEQSGVYYDRLFGGEFSKILTPASFFPMFACIPDARMAEKMVRVLTDESKLWTPVPLATVAKSHPAYSSDMWRGGVWLNLNYFIIKGLQNYGYGELAETLRIKTLETVEKWYKQTGAIFEFYDPEDKLLPYLCERKGKNGYPPDWRKHVHSIIDYNWSACFTLLFIQNELY